MSAQLLSSKKKQKRTHQSSIGSFLTVSKKLPVAQRNAGMIRCPYCPASVEPSVILITIIDKLRINNIIKA